MGLLIAHPQSDVDLRAAGSNGDGDFIIVSKGAVVFRVPEDRKVALAAYLLWGSLVLNQDALKLLRVAMAKKRLTKEHQDAIRPYVDAMEKMIEEMLQNDPRTSNKPEWHGGEGRQ